MQVEISSLVNIDGANRANDWTIQVLQNSFVKPLVVQIIFLKPRMKKFFKTFGGDAKATLKCFRPKKIFDPHLNFS